MPNPRTAITQTKARETEKAATVAMKRIREAIFDEVFRPGDHLVEVELEGKFKANRSPVGEALLALEVQQRKLLELLLQYASLDVSPTTVPQLCWRWI